MLLTFLSNLKMHRSMLLNPISRWRIAPRWYSPSSKRLTQTPLLNTQEDADMVQIQDPMVVLVDAAAAEAVDVVAGAYNARSAGNMAMTHPFATIACLEVVLHSMGLHLGKPSPVELL